MFPDNVKLDGVKSLREVEIKQSQVVFVRVDFHVQVKDGTIYGRRCRVGCPCGQNTARA